MKKKIILILSAMMISSAGTSYLVQASTPIKQDNKSNTASTRASNSSNSSNTSNASNSSITAKEEGIPSEIKGKEIKDEKALEVFNSSIKAMEEVKSYKLDEKLKVENPNKKTNVEIVTDYDKENHMAHAFVTEDTMKIELFIKDGIQHSKVNGEWNKKELPKGWAVFDLLHVDEDTAKLFKVYETESGYAIKNIAPLKVSDFMKLYPSRIELIEKIQNAKDEEFLTDVYIELDKDYKYKKSIVELKSKIADVFSNTKESIFGNYDKEVKIELPKEIEE